MLLLYADFILHGKDNANRRQYKASLFVFIVEVSLFLLKDSIVFLKKLVISRFLLNFFLKWSYKYNSSLIIQ